MKSCSTIMAILLENRNETAVAVQAVLTKYGCNIRARLGLREGAPDICTNVGIILLQLCGEENVADKMKAELDSIKTVKVKFMKLDF